MSFRLFSRIAARVGIQRVGSVTFLADLYSQYQIGSWSYGDLRVLDWGEGATLNVGAYVSVARGVTVLLGGEHRSDWVTTYPFSAHWPPARSFSGHPKTKGDVRIGNDVWIGFGATILSGVCIGDGAVLGAGALVSQDVPPYGIVAGNPARLIRRRFDDETIARLLRVKWWEWPEEVITRAMPDLLSRNCGNFLDRAESGVYGNRLPNSR